ncbi:MAG: type II/IV secretion system protein [Candidatus Magasanikbacteria bacterium]|nr:type II/IV secretion system protein [Candidatus Magasanikbacteria bacterium]
MPLKITSDEQEEQFGVKMKQIQIDQKEKEAEAAAAGFGVPYINLFRFPITAEALNLLPRAKADELKVICFFYNGTELRLGAIDPTNQKILDLQHELEERNHAGSAIYLISEHSWQEGMKFYETLPVIKTRTRDVMISETDIERFGAAVDSFIALDKQVKGASVTDVFSVLIAAALKFDASDIHIEAEETKIVARFRLDGILHPVADLPNDLWVRVISRLKLISGLKINIIDKPQDGRFTIAIKGQKIDVRVSTIPTVYGESAVLRILKPMAVVQFENLGVRGQSLEELQRQVERPNGMIMTTGPTGSGKTTTLYAVLQKLNEPGVKIITLEDPVEYKLEGINQSQIDPSHDYTFVKGLKSILRQDPDVVMVGEIRDLETAEVAIQAALTGHLMLSTIHTNSAAGAIPRFLSMGVKSFLLAPALNAVIGQRLVRKLCEKCKKETKLDEAVAKKVKETLGTIQNQTVKIDLNNLKFFASVGCEACQGLGYKGRIGIYEIMVMNKEIEQLILKSEVSEYVMQEIAVKNGMITMAQDGLLKALDKMTSVDEVFRVAE